MTTKVLTLNFVRASIVALQSQRIHPHFPVYMQLRRLVAEGADPTNVPFIPAGMQAMLGVPGGPPARPNFRPFSTANVRDPANWWLNKNLAGSYAPGSIRSSAAFLLDDAGHFILPARHAQIALDRFLVSKRVPAWAIAGYFMRNHGFEPTDDFVDDEKSLLFAGFKKFFGFRDTDDFDVLFDPDDSPDNLRDHWFEIADGTSDSGAEGAFDA